MPYTLGQAAKAVGKSKPTIARAIAKGTISAGRGPDRTWQIEPVELFRVFPPVTGTSGTPDITLVSHVPAREEGVLQREELLREMLERERSLNRELAADRDHWRAQATALIGTEHQPRTSWWRRWWRR